MSETSDRSLTRQLFLNGRERRLRAGWRLLVALVVFLVASLVVSVVLFVLQAGLVTTGIGTADLFVPQQITWNVLVTVFLVLLAWGVDRRTVPDLGLGGDGWWRNLGFGLVLGVVMTSAVFAAELAAGFVAVESTFVTREGLGVGASTPFALSLVVTFLMFVAVGVGEEVLFRGYFMTNLAEGLNGLGPIGPRSAIGIAAVLTAGVFGVVHLGNPNATLVSALNITAVGVFLAATYVVTEGLGIAIGVHITWNFALSSVYGFPVSGITTPVTLLDVSQTGDPLITGGPFGPEAGLVVYLALAVAIALTWAWVRWTRGPVGFPVGVALPDLRNAGDVSEGAPQKPPQTTGGTGGSGED